MRLQAHLFVVTKGRDDESERHAAEALHERQRHDPDHGAAGGHLEHVDHEDEHQADLKHCELAITKFIIREGSVHI